MVRLAETKRINCFNCIDCYSDEYIAYPPTKLFDDEGMYYQFMYCADCQAVYEVYLNNNLEFCFYIKWYEGGHL